MVARDDLRTSELQKLARRVDQLARKVTTGFSSITRGQLRIASNEGLLVQGSAKIEGWLVVTGTERVTGTLSVDGHLVVGGDMDFTGPMVVKGTAKFSGKLDVTGPTTITGTLDVSGGTRLRGRTTVESDLAVVAGGRVKVGSSMTLNPDANGGSMQFASGGQVRSDATSTFLVHDNVGVIASASDVTLVGGVSRVRVSAAGIQLFGVPKAARAGIASGGLWRDASGSIFEAP